MNITHGGKAQKKVSINIENSKIVNKGRNKFQVVTPVQGDPEPTLEAENEHDYRRFTDYFNDVASGKFDVFHERIDGRLSIKVMSLTSLPTLSRLGRPAQPYVMVFVGNEHLRTRPGNHPVNPTWEDQILNFIVTSTGSEAILMVMDDVPYSSHQHIGRVRLRLDDYIGNTTTEVLPLEIFGSEKKNTESLITVEINYDVNECHTTEPIFGEPLANVISRPSNNGLLIPIFVQRSIDVLRQTSLELDGIFRESGSQASIADLKMDIDKGENIDFINRVESMHDVTGLLKLYFRELPVPLLTFYLHDKFLSLADSASENITNIKELVDSLPQENYILLRELTIFLHEISTHSSVNRMTADNLGIVFGPNLLRPPKTGDAIASMFKAPSLYSAMITHCHEIFTK
eukprot:TRINITY_DN4459_c0_g1_i1.p1 TRINITY_DN4459_c0_g1~~TRINITY_DN4459_c0_g1_i1.p1  ORF type:complete len:462 (+),score=30.44 TRINITY_DN4459_c0_g1_i1:181-1386(+)